MGSHSAVMRRQDQDTRNMSNHLRARLETISVDRLKGMRRGLEKECLRVLSDGTLALTPHPPRLGAALTHPHITTDFSESQLEFITGVHANADAALKELAHVHQFTYLVLDQMGDERLWVSSMPCELPADEVIPIGRYGSSNAGRAKSVYRMGLSHRYGRRMQAISGIHYNWSLPGVSSQDYFALIRNFRRHAFLVLFLFGASPALCSSFVATRPNDLQALGESSLFMPYGTSLRMGRLGYHSEAQAALTVGYSSLDKYSASLHDALTRSWPAYEAIGIRDRGGDYNQLSTSALQLENEFYATIRPKRVVKPGERPLHALHQRGVEYVEVRLLDLDPFEPLGINARTMRFIDIFLMHCLLSESPFDTSQENAEIAQNQVLTAGYGRRPHVRLQRGGREVTLVDWGKELVEQCHPIAEALDAALGESGKYVDAVNWAVSALHEPDSLPSARVLQTIESKYQKSFLHFTRDRSAQVRDEMLALNPFGPQQLELEAMAEASARVQERMEAADGAPFESYRQGLVSSA